MAKRFGAMVFWLVIEQNCFGAKQGKAHFYYECQRNDNLSDEARGAREKHRELFLATGVSLRIDRIQSF